MPRPDEDTTPGRRPSAARPAPTPRAQLGWRLLLVLLLSVTTWLAWTPDPPPRLDTGWDKANHLLAFTALTVTALLGARPRRRRDAACAAALLAYGTLIEAVQAFVPGRSAEPADLLADATGIGCALLLARALRL